MKYNISSFNIHGDDTQEPLIIAYCSGKIECMVRSDTNIDVQAQGAGKLLHQSQFSSTTPLNLNGHLTVTAKSEAIPAVMVQGNGLIGIDLESIAKENCYLNESVDVEISCTSYAGQDIYYEPDGHVQINTNFEPTKYIFLNQHHYTEHLRMNTSSTILKEECGMFSELKRGDRLVIDSENFTVTKNGKNALKDFGGAWLELSRETEHLLISGFDENGELKGKIIFKERFL